MKIEIAVQIFVKFFNMRFHENPSTCYRVVPFVHKDRRTGWKNLQTVCRIENLPKNLGNEGIVFSVIAYRFSIREYNILMRS
jgi:hypothetical protein